MSQSTHTTVSTASTTRVDILATACKATTSKSEGTYSWMPGYYYYPAGHPWEGYKCHESYYYPHGHPC
jgi:hypothetical protein